MPELFGFDCYSPQQIAERVESVGRTKANLPLVSTIVLGVLAGGFIGLGGLYYTLVISGSFTVEANAPARLAHFFPCTPNPVMLAANSLLPAESWPKPLLAIEGKP